MWLLGKIPSALTPVYSLLITRQLIRERSSPGWSFSGCLFLRNAGVEDISYRKKGDNFHGLWFVCTCVLMYLSNRLRIKQIWGWSAGKLNLTPWSSIPYLWGWFSLLQWKLCVLQVWLHIPTSFHTGFLLESYDWYNLALPSHTSTAKVYWDVL